MTCLFPLPCNVPWLPRFGKIKTEVVAIASSKIVVLVSSLPQQCRVTSKGEETKSHKLHAGASKQASERPRKIKR